MSANGISTANEFRRAVEQSNVERIVLPASGLAVRLCRPPVFAALELGRMGTLLQAKVTDAKPEEIKTEDVEAFTRWLTDTLARLFVQPRFAAAPAADQIGLGDILIDDLKFIFRWLRGEVFTTRDSGLGTRDSGPLPKPESPTPNPGLEDLGRFPDGQGSDRISGGSGQAEFLSSERAAGTHRHARVSVGLYRG